MNKSKLINYRFLAVMLFITSLILIYININLINKIRSNQESVSVFSVIPSITKTREYGYTEAVKVLLNDEYTILTNIVSNNEGKRLIQVEGKFNGDISRLYSKLQSLKDEDNFDSLDEIKISTDSDNIQSNYFKVTLRASK